MTDAASTSSNGNDPFLTGADALRAAATGTPTPDPAAPVNGTNGHKVIDLREAATTRVRVSRDDNPFNALSKQERMRLIVRVLCEIVAYGELEDEPLADEVPPAVNS